MTNTMTDSGVGEAGCHFVLVPLMAQGHTIPMIDLARLLAQRDAQVTFITTPFNASRIRTTIDRVHDSGLPIKFVELPFPCKELDLPEGCENLDVVPSTELAHNFFDGLRLLAKPLETYLRQLPSPPSCMIVDFCHPWTREVAHNLQIPRLTFFSMCCFTLLCIHNVSHYKVFDNITDEHEAYAVPGLTHKILVTKAQAPEWFSAPGWEKFAKEVKDAQLAADGIVVNTFDDLEPSYINDYQKAMGKKVWAVGPFSLYNKDLTDMVVRGNKTSIDANRCMSWLNAREPKSVVYVSFGTLTFVGASQLMEVGLGLEASSHPFVWVIKNNEMSHEVEEWLSKGFEERTQSRGFIIKGWAPQVMILSHPAIGGFMTHCGWNSTLEGVSAGVPMITWPHFGDQFLNERMIVDVLGIGVSIRVVSPTRWAGNNGNDEDHKRLSAMKDDVERAIRSVMEGEEAEERRRRVTELGKKAREAMSEGSSYANMTNLIRSFTRNE